MRARAPALSGERLARAAQLAVLLTAFAPMAFFFSAVYSESLYLALSVGLFWSARHGRWAWVGVLGALAGATRSAGLVLVLPALMLYLYGPREDRPPDHPSAVGGSRLRPRYRLRRDALWLALLPVGAILYGAYLGLAGGDPLAPLHAQEVWSRHFAGPFVGVWDALRAAFEGARQLLSLQRHHIYFATGTDSPFVMAGHNLMLLAFLLAAIPRVVGVLRRLPLAYGAYVIAALALPLSDPVSPAAADVAAALPAGAVPARHLARGVAQPGTRACSARRWSVSCVLMVLFSASSQPGTGSPRALRTERER